jgi:hypothetical protein
VSRGASFSFVEAEPPKTFLQKMLDGIERKGRSETAHQP